MAGGIHLDYRSQLLFRHEAPGLIGDAMPKKCTVFTYVLQDFIYVNHYLEMLFQYETEKKYLKKYFLSKTYYYFKQC